MATQIAEAYVQIKPTTKGIKNELTQQLGGEVSSAGDSAGASFGSAMVSKLKSIVAAAGIGKIVKNALDAGGAVQQSFGGLDTLYGDASEAAKKYAREAVSAGISMNDYAEQAVSFGASLKQAFAGDTTKAVEAANTAIMDMADNAAKMGTPLESIQNAYQGFAKQNYTMLDNLKLGYGGTKQEMERLLADAQKLSGVKYDLDNLGDVYAAIHVIQEDLGLTGVAAQEASETFTGSMAAMKAAATNFMADLTLGNDVSESLNKLASTTGAFVKNNLLPMLGNLVKAIPSVLQEVSRQIILELNKLFYNLDFNSAFDAGVQFVQELVEGVIANIPYIAESAIKLLAKFIETLINYDWASTGQNIIQSFKDSFDLASGEILGSDDSFLKALINNITETLPEFLAKGREVITNIVNGLLEQIPSLLSAAGEMVSTLIEGIAQVIPQLVSSAAEMVGQLAQGLIDNAPAIMEAGAELVNTIRESIWNGLVDMFGGEESPIGSWIAGHLEGLETIIVAITGALAGYKVVATATAAATNAMSIATKAASIAQGILNAVLTANPIGIVVALIAALAAAIAYLWNNNEDFRNGVTKVWETIKTVVGGVVEGLVGFFTETLPNAINNVKQFFVNIGEAIAEFFTVKIPAAWENVKGFFETIWNFIKDFLDRPMYYIGYAIGAYLKLLTDFYSKIINGLINFFTVTIPNAWEKFTTWLSDTGTSVKEKVEEFLKSVGEKIKTFFTETIPTAWNNFKSKLSEAKETLKTKIKEFLNEQIERLKEFFTVTIPNAWNNFKTWLFKIPGQIKEIFTNLPGQLKQIGLNLIQGLWNGIKEKWEALKKNVTDLANGLVDGLKGTFKIGSPSKLLRDEIGKWLPAGIAVGIKANASSVTDAMDDLSEQTINAGLSGIDYSYSSYNSPIISENNQPNTQELGILNDIKEGIQALQNMAIVMDTGATVGALAMPMNGALGRIQSREGRR